MIGTIDVNIQAARPDFPLTPFKAFVNSPSSVRVRNVPKKIGKWDVTKVYVNANYPDNMVRSAECVLTAGIWVGTIAASTSVGTSLNGYTITADGTDENGAAVTGYILGKGDVEILDADGTITPAETTYYLHILPSAPTTPKQGDAYVDGGTWWVYNGSAWTTLGGTYAGNGWAQWPTSEGGDNKWHRVIISQGAIAYDEQGVDEPPTGHFAIDSQVVHNSGNETIAGTKTFSSAIVGNLTGDVTGNVTGNVSGNATTATTATTALACSGNSATATKLATARSLNVQDADATNTGTAAIFDGSGNATIKLPSTIKASITGNVTGHASQDAKDSEVVKLAGEQTITGTKTINNILLPNGAITKSSSVVDGETPTSQKYVSVYSVVDRDGKVFGTISASQNPDGNQAFSFNSSQQNGTYRRYCSFSCQTFNNANKTTRLYTNADKCFGSAFAAAGMPSASFLNLTLPPNGGTYTPTQNGYVYFRRFATAVGQYIGLCEGEAASMRNTQYAAISNVALASFIPVRANMAVTVIYTAEGEIKEFCFIKANAEVA